MTWFLGADNYFSHPADDSEGHRLALATLMANGHARPWQIQKTLGTAPRSLVRWRKQLDTQGAASFYQPRGVRGTAVLTVETSAQCQRLLDEGHSIATTARLADIKDTTLRKAIAAGRIAKPSKPNAKPSKPAAAPLRAKSPSKNYPKPATASSISSFEPPGQTPNAPNHFPRGSGCLNMDDQNCVGVH